MIGGMSTITDYVAACTAAKVAIDASDWATAVNKLQGALALLAALPDTQHGDERLTWRSEDLQGLLRHAQAQLNAQQNATVARLRGTKYTRKRVSS